MLGRLLLIVLFVPLLELWLLLEVTRRTSLLTTVVVVIVTGFSGMFLVRWQGLQAWRQIHQQLSAGKSPSRQITHGVLILLAGAFLITPGLLTDLVGFTLLIPKFRDWLTGQLQERVLRSFSTSVQSHVWVAGMDADPFVRSSGNHVPTMDSERQPQVRVVDPGSDRTLE